MSFPSSICVSRSLLKSGRVPRSVAGVPGLYDRHLRSHATHSQVENNEKPFEPIMEESTLKEEKKLNKEGIPYFKIPIPDIEKN